MHDGISGVHLCWWRANSQPRLSDLGGSAATVGVGTLVCGGIVASLKAPVYVDGTRTGTSDTRLLVAQRSPARADSLFHRA